jgi:hypothetical protein
MIRYFALTLRALPGSPGAYRRLARTLKTALRRDLLRCVDIREQTTAFRRRPAQVTGIKQARRQEKIIMDMRKYNGAFFLKPGDLKAGPIRVVIVDVVEGKFGRPDLEFDDGSKLSVNATNNRTLVLSYGAESDGWLNKEVELSIGLLEYKGEPQDSVLIKPISPPNEKKTSPPKPKSGNGVGMDEEIPF